MITQERKNQLRNGLVSALEDEIKKANRYIDREEFDYIWSLRNKFEDIINAEDEISAEDAKHFENIGEDDEVAIAIDELTKSLEHFGCEVQDAVIAAFKEQVSQPSEDLTAQAEKELVGILETYKSRYEKIVQDEDATEEEIEFDLSLLCFEFVTRLGIFGYEEDAAIEMFWEKVSVYYEFADEENAIVMYDDGVAIRENDIEDGCLVSSDVRKQLIERFAWNESCFQLFGRDYLITLVGKV
jgi:hypothetical protein